MRITIKDVADRAGVSSATVSNVINDKGKVSESTRRQVLEVIDQLHYRPTASAQRRYKVAAKSIGLVIKEMDNPYFADVIVGAQEAAEAAGYEVMVASSEGRRETEDRVVDLFIAQDVTGIIINPLLDGETDLSHLFELKRRNIPFVLLERVHGLRASLVDVDNASASCEAAKHLIELGHERIVHFAGPGYSMHSAERTEGFRQAFFDAQMLFQNESIVPSGSHLEDGYRTGMDYFKGMGKQEMPTAVTCYNDLVALGLCRALDEIGLTVPDDVSVIGYGDLPILEYLPMPLTTVRVPKFEMGKTAANLLIRQLRSGDPVAPERVNLATELVLRRSTRPLEQTAAR